MTTAPDPEDLTARARIRDAAMWHFGEHGFERATIRGIAETAGVSLGLVRHHFGSKEALREACDEHLMKTIHRLHEHAASAQGGLNPVAAMGPYQRYLARALADGWAAPLFDEMVRIGERWLTEADKRRPDPPDVDAKARSAVIAAMALSVAVLSQHLSRGLGVDVTTPEGEAKLLRVLLDVYSHPLLTPEEAAAARAALDGGRAT
ncbi:TetR/AcrR family transcriptional regulator [Nonomuraea zeae]|uniref:TetR/AcrR family transcriptional regulator n=1 Tax=Nonomuraea zeae TaxID=1642303 RepID=UPI0023F1DB66|nr:TetR/AcrR family transcriptional regulator [Nonomuraea zeae]